MAKNFNTSLKVFKLKKSKRGFGSKLHESVVDFYGKNDNSTALPGKGTLKTVNVINAQAPKESPEWLLKQSLLKVCCRKPKSQPIISTFARMRLSFYVLANFVNRCSCLCTQHENMASKLKLWKKND